MAGAWWPLVSPCFGLGRCARFAHGSPFVALCLMLPFALPRSAACLRRGSPLAARPPHPPPPPSGATRGVPAALPPPPPFWIPCRPACRRLSVFWNFPLSVGYPRGVVTPHLILRFCPFVVTALSFLSLSPAVRCKVSSVRLTLIRRGAIRSGVARRDAPPPRSGGGVARVVVVRGLFRRAPALAVVGALSCSVSQPAPRRAKPAEGRAGGVAVGLRPPPPLLPT